MLTDLNARLVEVKEKLRQRERTQSRLADVEHSLAQEDLRLEGLEYRLAREQKDVKALEGLSLYGLFYTILGDKESRLDKERQEYLAALLQRDQCQHAVTSMESELADLKKQLMAFEGLDAAYQSLLERKEGLLRSAGDARARQLIDLSDQQAALRSTGKELREAVEAGQALQAMLDEVIDSLRSAEGWGTWDLLGGGLLSDLAKHSRIDEARSRVHEAQELMRRFQHELADVPSGESFLIDISSFDTFADFFFDGLIVDWIVQSKIRNSLERTVQVRQLVADILQALGNRLEQNERLLKAAQDQRRTLIEN
jgi:hypothetical protein